MRIACNSHPQEKGTCNGDTYEYPCQYPKTILRYVRHEKSLKGNLKATRVQPLQMWVSTGIASGSCAQHLGHTGCFVLLRSRVAPVDSSLPRIFACFQPQSIHVRKLMGGWFFKMLSPSSTAMKRSQKYLQPAKTTYSDTTEVKFRPTKSFKEKNTEVGVFASLYKAA